MQSFLSDLCAGSGEQQIPFFVLAGPCVIESEAQCLRIAAAVRDICADLNMPVVFKASYDKANRTSGDAFRGPGLKAGLEILKKVRDSVRLPVISDIHLPAEAAAAATVVDMLQIPALLCRQTDLLVAAGRTNLPVNIKKGQFLAPSDMAHVVQKVVATGNTRIVLTERGTSFGYHNLVVDMRSFALLRELSYPVLFDATHSVQLPGAGCGKSDGERRFVRPLALAAAAAGAQGLFLEVHDAPDTALCDGPNMVPLGELSALLRSARAIQEYARVAGAVDAPAADAGKLSARRIV